MIRLTVGEAAMKTTSPYLHDFIRSLRSGLPVFICGLTAFTLLVPVSTAAVPERSIFNITYTHEQLKFRFYESDLGLAVTLAVVLFGAALALVLFGFLCDKRASVAYLSMGVGRVRLFVHRFIVGLLYLFFGIGIPLVVSLGLNSAALGMFDGELEAFVFLLVGFLVSGLIAFGLAAVACVCAGTLFECVSFAAALIGFVSVAAFCLDALTTQLLVASPFGKTAFGADATIAPSFVASLAAFNPLLFFGASSAAQQTFSIMHPVYVPAAANWAPIVIWAIFALVSAALAAVLLRRRPGEQAQIAGICTPLSFFTAAVASFALFGAVFTVIASVNLAVGLISAALAFVALSVFLLRGPLRGRSSIGRSVVVLAGECVCAGVLVVVIGTGAFGFSGWVPAASQVSVVEVSYVGTPSYLARPLFGTASDAAYYYHTEYAYSDARSIGLVLDAHQNFVGSARAPFALDEADFAATVVRYDVVMRYTLIDGTVAVRYFDRARIGELESLLALDDSPTTLALEHATLTGDSTGLSDSERTALAGSNTSLAYRVGTVYVTDANYNVVTTLSLGDVPRNALLRALATDIAAQDATARYTQPVQPLATLMFTNAPHIDASTFGFSFSNAVVPITPDFTHTLSWFKANRLEDYLADGVNPALIEQIAWLPDNPYASVVNSAAKVPTSRFFMGYRSGVAGRFWAAPDFGSPQTTSDAMQIAEVASQLKTACFMSGGYLVQAKLKGVDVWVYYYLPALDAPDFIVATGGGM